MIHWRYAAGVSRRVALCAIGLLAAWSCGTEGERPADGGLLAADATAELEQGAPDSRLDADGTSADSTPERADAEMDVSGEPAPADAAVDSAEASVPDSGPPADATLDAGDAVGLDRGRDATPLDPEREHRCEDGLDDDGDGAIDCFDGDCLDDAPCAVVPETPVQFVQELFLQRCGCHTGALDAGGLRLVRPFTDTTVSRPAILDPGRLLVAPGDASASFLYLKLLDGLPPEHGERMPPEIPYFDAEQLRVVADWIDGLEG